MASKVDNFESVRYPDEVGTNEVPNYIRFEPVEVQYGGTYKAHGNQLDVPSRISNTGRSVSYSNSVDSGTYTFSYLPSIMNSANHYYDELTRTGGFSYNLGGTGINRVVSGRTAISPYQLHSAMKTTPNRLFTQGSINLYLPESLATNTAADYSNTDLTATGFEAVNVVNNQGSKADGLGQNSGGENNGIMSLFPAMIRDAANLSDTLAAAAAISQGVVTNNYSYQIFGGVQHRSFSYSFKLVPRKPEDSVTIKYICDLFLYYMLPTKSKSDFHLYEIPCQWNIAYMRKGNKMRFHQQPYPCFLQAVNVGYGADTGNATFNDGSPMEVTLDLEFVEIEPMYRRGELN